MEQSKMLAFLALIIEQKLGDGTPCLYLSLTLYVSGICIDLMKISFSETAPHIMSFLWQMDIITGAVIVMFGKTHYTIKQFTYFISNHHLYLGSFQL